MSEWKLTRLEVDTRNGGNWYFSVTPDRSIAGGFCYETDERFRGTWAEALVMLRAKEILRIKHIAIVNDHDYLK